MCCLKTSLHPIFLASSNGSPEAQSSGQTAAVSGISRFPLHAACRVARGTGPEHLIRHCLHSVRPAQGHARTTKARPGQAGSVDLCRGRQPGRRRSRSGADTSRLSCKPECDAFICWTLLEQRNDIK